MEAVEIEKVLNEYEKAYETFLDSYKAALVKEGTKAFIQGDLKAQKALKLKLNFNLVNKEALKYIKKYKQELDKGGSTIQGKWVPWLEDMAKEDRAKIAKILEEGYKAGKPTGVKEYKRGGYPKNSIANDLQGFFSARRSHAATVARTEIARIQSHGSVNRYQIQGVKKVMWLVFNPCDICSQYARRVYEIDKVPAEVPRHPNCRCALAPMPDAVPTGPAPNQEIPEVFERSAKALPAKPVQPEKWQVSTIRHDRAKVPYEATTTEWEAYETKVAKQKFSESEADGLRFYIGSGYTRMNKMLRDPDPDHFLKWLADWDFRHVETGTPEEAAAEYIKNKLKPMAGAIEDSLAKSTIPNETILYRAPGRTVAKELMERGEATDPGFMSTSSKFNSSYSAFGKQGQGGYTDIIVLKGRPGDKALYINTGENEVLYQKGQKMKLLGVREVDTVEMKLDWSDTPYTTKNIRFLFCKII